MSSSDGGHRRMTREAARDLAMLLLVLAAIISGMLAFRKQLGDKEGDAERDWYYQRIAPKGSQGAARPTGVNR